MHGYHVKRYAQKCEAFGWKTLIIDGHDMQQIAGALDKARLNGKIPTMIIAKTIKGYGVAQAENKEGFHGKAFSEEELKTFYLPWKKDLQTLHNSIPVRTPGNQIYLRHNY